ncbi:uncharacterized protein LOC120653514 [Panicum virgatum]|uniref:uncharacterized protein LOC120653514 n=1 Tax=Panicum virgatum TaxID=38727 RepID=UPI0019D5C06D|nr:uncharacterized protein LOC120653514 [Panicum virgatum]
MADDLGALGEPITDRTLVLNVIRGLNERFSHIGTLLRHARLFTSFLEARDDLILEEITLENRQSSPAAALTASAKSTAPPPQPQPHSGVNVSGTGNKTANRRNKRCGGGGGGNSTGTGGPSGVGGSGQQAPGAQQQQPDLASGGKNTG